MAKHASGTGCVLPMAIGDGHRQHSNAIAQPPPCALIERTTDPSEH